MLEAATTRHRRELNVHCYHLLASYDEVEDAVQETFLRAWRSRDTFDGEHVRARLDKIATHPSAPRTQALRSPRGQPFRLLGGVSLHE